MAMNNLAAASGTFMIGGDLPVYRLGYGAMRITGDGIWGPPKDRAEALTVLRRCLDLGINLIDTADSYGPHVSEELIAEALHPYPDELVIATKGGFTRPGPGEWVSNGRPEYLRDCLEGSLRRLRLERIDLYQLHRIDPNVPAEESLGVLRDMQREGKIRHIGISEVSVDQIKAARKVVDVVTVQNRYNLADREHEAVLDYCTAEKIGFIPWFPLAVGDLARSGSKLDQVAQHLDAAPSQIALAWLLQRSPVMLPIPGTSSAAHLDENMRAAQLSLSAEEMAAL